MRPGSKVSIAVAITVSIATICTFVRDAWADKAAAAACICALATAPAGPGLSGLGATRVGGNTQIAANADLNAFANAARACVTNNAETKLDNEDILCPPLGTINISVDTNPGGSATASSPDALNIAVGGDAAPGTGSGGSATATSTGAGGGASVAVGGDGGNGANSGGTGGNATATSNGGDSQAQGGDGGDPTTDPPTPRTGGNGGSADANSNAGNTPTTPGGSASSGNHGTGGQASSGNDEGKGGATGTSTAPGGTSPNV